VSYDLLIDALDKSNNTMANAINGEVEEDEERKPQEEDMEEGKFSVFYIQYFIVNCKCFKKMAVNIETKFI
jgi:hypothetical protein